MRGAISLAVAIVLLAAQAGIVAIGLFRPNVSAHYRAFFIDHTEPVWTGEPDQPDRSRPIPKS